MEIINKPLKIFPLALTGYIFYAVYQCPCDKLLSCAKGPTLGALGVLAALVIFGYPLILSPVV